MAREWNATDYHRLSEPQVAWGRRVLERLQLRGDERVVDAGCGTGRLTAGLLDRLHAGHVIALDRSFNMLQAARDHLGSRGRGSVTFMQADLNDLPIRGWADVIFSTATFHWVLDHPRLFAGLYAALADGGLLIAQCGGAGNLRRIHQHSDEVSRLAPFRQFFADWSTPWEFASPETTAGRLAAAGFVDIETSLEPAPTTFPRAEEFAAFGATVVFRPYAAKLPGEEVKQAFIRAVTERASGDPVPFTFDYMRLNLRARKPLSLAP
jgi:trans-aconitate methyltransferase